MLKYDYSKKHTAREGLREVHANMINRYKIVEEDKIKAKKMQDYLQYFKKIFYNPKDYLSDDEMIKMLGLEELAISEMRQRFQEILGVSERYNQIFRSEHSWYAHRKDFDDIVEGELNALLQTVAERATGVQEIDLGQKMVGNIPAIIDIDSIGSDLIDKISNSFYGKISQKTATKLIDEIKVVQRSGKVDVSGYNKELVVQAKIDSSFQDFINLFSGVSFSVKNYKGNKYQQIHLGDSNPFKAMYSILKDIGYDSDSALHIYAHSRFSYNKDKNVISRNNDIFHLRFIYELMGAGLKHPETEKDFSVDFLIYNDPKSDKIFVKSTKELIADILDSKNMKITNPWSGIYISKLNFK